MKLVVFDTEFPCAKAIKTNNSITLFDTEGNSTVQFSDISDFSVYTLIDGEWSAPPPSREDRLEAQATYTAMMTDTLLSEEE